MKIKGVTKRGDPILNTPKELVGAAVLYGLKMQNTTEKVYAMMGKTLTVSKFSSFELPQTKLKTRRGQPIYPTWKAKAEGTVEVGIMDAKKGRAKKPCSHHFEVEYEFAKDDLGLPDTKVTSFKITPNPKNPSKRIPYAQITASLEQLKKHSAQFKKPEVEKKKKQNPLQKPQSAVITKTPDGASEG